MFLIERAVNQKLKKVTDDHIITEVIQSRVHDEALVDAVTEKLVEERNRIDDQPTIIEEISEEDNEDVTDQ